MLSGQPEAAASLLERLDGDRLLQGEGLAAMQRWRDQLPRELMYATPRLLILDAWALLLGGCLDEAESVANRLARFLPQPNARRQSGLLAQWQVLAGMIACRRGQPGRGSERLRVGLEWLTERAWAHRLLAQGELIELASADARYDEAQAWRWEACRLARAHDSLVLEGLLLLQRVRELTARGELDRALHELQRLQQEPDAVRPLAGQILLHLGVVLSARGEWQAAAEHYLAAMRLCQEVNDAGTVLCHLGMAELDVGGG